MAHSSTSRCSRALRVQHEAALLSVANAVASEVNPLTLVDTATTRLWQRKCCRCARRPQILRQAQLRDACATRGTSRPGARKSIVALSAAESRSVFFHEYAYASCAVVACSLRAQWHHRMTACDWHRKRQSRCHWKLFLPLGVQREVRSMWARRFMDPACACIGSSSICCCGPGLRRHLPGIRRGERQHAAVLTRWLLLPLQHSAGDSNPCLRQLLPTLLYSVQLVQLSPRSKVLLLSTQPLRAHLNAIGVARSSSLLLHGQQPPVEFPSCPLVATTGVATGDGRRSCTQAGCSGSLCRRMRRYWCAAGRCSSSR